MDSIGVADKAQIRFHSWIKEEFVYNTTLGSIALRYLGLE